MTTATTTSSATSSATSHERCATSIRLGEVRFLIPGFGLAGSMATTYQAACKRLARYSVRGIGRLILDETGQDYIAQAHAAHPLMTKAEAVAVWIEAVGGGSTVG